MRSGSRRGVIGMVVVLAALAAGGPVARGQTILLYDDNSAQMRAIDAATRLGRPFTRARSSDFVTLLTGSSWDLVIVDMPSTLPLGDWQTPLASHIAAGRRAIYSCWDPGTLGALPAAFQVTIGPGHETVPFYQWSGDPLFSAPQAVPASFTMFMDIWGTNGFYLDPFGGARAAGGFTPTPSPGQAAIVVGNSGRTIWNGFLFDDYGAFDSDFDGIPDITELLMNEIAALLPPPSMCGNGITEAGEVCDDGNTASCDGCRGDCMASDVVGCNIGGGCVAEGTVNPSNQCEACRRAIDAARYTARPAGTGCDDGQFCTVGDNCNGASACTGSARDCSDGVMCTTDGCDEAGDRCTSTVTAGCLIGGACIPDGMVDPGNICRACVGATSRTAWSPRAAGTPCGDPACLDGTLMPAPLCDGSGSCAPGGPMGCPGGICADEFSCTGSCMDNSGCPLARFCASGGRCMVDLPEGETCDRPGMCASGFCVDGFCCDDGCDGLCVGCDRPGDQGTCSPHDRGSDPDDDCTDPQVCDGTGACFDPTPDAGPGMDAGGNPPDARTDASSPPAEAGRGRLETHGSGLACHAAGGGTGAWVVVLVLAWLARRRRRW